MAGFHEHVIGHLVRRGAVMANDPAYVQKSQEQAPAENMSPVQVLVIALTFLAFIVAIVSADYTLGTVVASLTMIETPSQSASTQYQPLDNFESDIDAPVPKPNAADGDLALLKEKPLTSSIRQTMRHLTRVGGFLAYWRGLNISIFYNVAQGFLFLALSRVFGLVPFVGGGFAAFLASVATAVVLLRIHMTWTHIVISEPSPIRWYRRIPRGPTYFKALATPTAIFVIAQNLTIALSMVVHSSFGAIPDLSDRPATPAEGRTEILRLFATLATAAFVALALLLPASVTLTRVEASLLPDDAETIVNFDRTLGGSAINLVGFGKNNFRALYDAAWRSFDKSSRIRLVKFYLKYFAILLVLDLAFGAVMAGELIAFVGADKASAFVHNINAQLQGAARSGM